MTFALGGWTFWWGRSACRFVTSPLVRLQEYTFTTLQYAHPAVMSTVLTFVTMSIGAAQGGFRDRKAPLAAHIAVGALSCATVSLSNFSLLYLNFGTQIIFKSSKVVPVMVVGSIVWGKRFSWLQYASALVMVVGLVMVRPFCLDARKGGRVQHLCSLLHDMAPTVVPGV